MEETNPMTYLRRNDDGVLEEVDCRDMPANEIIVDKEFLEENKYVFGDLSRATWRETGSPIYPVNPPPPVVNVLQTLAQYLETAPMTVIIDPPKADVVLQDMTLAIRLEKAHTKIANQKKVINRLQEDVDRKIVCNRDLISENAALREQGKKSEERIAGLNDLLHKMHQLETDLISKLTRTLNLNDRLINLIVKSMDPADAAQFFSDADNKEG